VKRSPNFVGFSSDDEPDSPIDSDNERPDVSDARRIEVMADYGTYPLWALDDGLVGDFAPNHLGVSLELENDLWSWAADFDMSLNVDDPANSHWPEERRRHHIQEGLALARRIKLELPDREVFALDAEGALVEITGDDPAVPAS
jgi:hypothetical protein